MEENELKNSYDEMTIDGTKIVASITVDGETYYIDQVREVYEKVNNLYYKVTSETIKEAVRKVLYKSSDNFMM